MKDKNDLKREIESNLLKDAKKLRGKYLPISEKVMGTQKVFTIKNIYELSGRLKSFYIIMIKDEIAKKNRRFFIVIQLASQSSDFLVKIAKEIIKQKEIALKLIQYAIHPKSLRINLLCMSELKNTDDISDLIKELGEVRILFQDKIDSIVKI